MCRNRLQKKTRAAEASFDNETLLFYRFWLWFLTAFFSRILGGPSRHWKYIVLGVVFSVVLFVCMCVCVHGSVDVKWAGICIDIYIYIYVCVYIVRAIVYIDMMSVRS